MLHEMIAVVVAWLALPSPLAMQVAVLFLYYAGSDSAVWELLRRSVANPVTTCVVVALSTCMWSWLPWPVAIPTSVLLVLVALVNPAVIACLRRVDVRDFHAANDEIVNGVKLLLLIHIRPPPRATSSRLVVLAFVRDEVITATLQALLSIGYRYAAGTDNSEGFLKLVCKNVISTFVPPFLYKPVT
ncbi:hypothetical protein SDRG_02619 [Saprolegnia diclina VS20]|uniref:Uncharacterized protein n=1 Tax=Saprolegnia diclina (strain VS20) TaxID=1156394 RepID=T0S4M3_SAPDV|nr:hypothetical protein SDRG_02619 [Saprolegnia diclina VS20]EQC39963.1 hypothetical protein SDRG_02619 [Saprolegnia diclina VS20]|eukprot:XP_008606437.1 hypothetical protein SDRG_02619 [Saprolegnia diclina VS20]